MVIDYEENGCTLADLREAVDMLTGDPRGLRVTIYSGHLLKQQLGSERDEYLATNTDLWLAQYTTGTPSWPSATYPQWTLWQYSESGEVDGITGSKVDLDRFNGDDDALLRWISPAAPQPEPIEVRVPVTVALTVPEQVTLTISVNGEIIAVTQA
jgi:lysozyme